MSYFRSYQKVFFRFIKQELNVSHLVSLNKNGILLNLEYKSKETIGNGNWKLTIAFIVFQCGGDPKLFFKHKK